MKEGKGEGLFCRVVPARSAQAAAQQGTTAGSELSTITNLITVVELNAPLHPRTGDSTQGEEEGEK